MQPLAIGLDLGGTQLRAALIDPSGRVEERIALATEAQAGPEVVVGQIVEAVARVSRSVDRKRIRGVGVSAPGPLDTVRGIALALPTLAGFVDFPLAETLARRTGLPVRLENDGIAAVLAEWRFGAGRGCDNVVYVTLSTGIGGGVVVDGRVLRGRMGMAGHVGHMTIVRDGAPCPCGNRGCFEAYASGPAFAARASARLGRPTGAEAVFAAATGGDAVARALVAEEADLIGTGIANLLHLYSPQVVVLGGGLSTQFDALAPGIAARLGVSAMPSFRDVPVVSAALGGNAGLVGAGILILDPAA